MTSEYGGKNVRTPGNGNGSKNSDSRTTGEADNVKRLLGSSDMSIDDQIAMHLVDCDQCRESIQHLRPIGLGQKSGHCETYWELQLMRARYEGAVNNIVAYNEFGNEAPKGRPLE